MDLLSPTRTNTSLVKGNALAFAASLFVVVAGLTSATKTPIWFMVMAMGCMIFGWLLMATLVTHLSPETGIGCELPDVQTEFHAQSQVPIVVRLLNTGNHIPILFLTVELVTETDGRLLNSPPKFVGQIPSRCGAEFEWRLTLRRRGDHFLRGVSAKTAFPGSILSREFVFGFDRALLALPVVYKLIPRADQVLAGRKRAFGHQPTNPVAMEEFVGVREYRPGDNPRNVSLALSLRMPDYPWQLVVREYEDPNDDEVCVVLDTAVPNAESESHTLALYRFEKAVSFSVALCRRLCEQKHRIRFVACLPAGEPVDLRITIPSRDVPILERRLAKLQGTPSPDAVSRLLKKQTTATDAIVIFVSLQERFETFTRTDENAVWISPEWQSSLVAEVAG